MKHLLTVILCLSSLSTLAQNNEYNISSLQQKGSRAPNTHYIGDAWLRSIVEAKEDNGFNVTKYSDVTYLAIYSNSTPTVWTEVLSQEYYDNVATMLSQ